MAGMSTPIAHVLDDPGAVWTDNEVVSNPTWVFVAADGSRVRLVTSLGPQRLIERLEALAEA
jgi:hypothetical protein